MAAISSTVSDFDNDCDLAATARNQKSKLVIWGKDHRITQTRMTDDSDNNNTDTNTRCCCRSATAARSSLRPTCVRSALAAPAPSAGWMRTPRAAAVRPGPARARPCRPPKREARSSAPLRPREGRRRCVRTPRAAAVGPGLIFYSFDFIFYPTF